MPKQFFATLIITGLAGTAPVSTAIAQDAINACVMCSDPDHTYACEVLPPETGEMAQSPQLFCAGELAKAHGHKSCAVVRSPTQTCQGKRMTLAYTGPIRQRNEDPIATVQESNPVTTQENAPPKTLVEATDRAVTSTGKQLKNAGNAIASTGEAVQDVTKKTGQTIKKTGESVGETVSKAAKTSWNCLVSLFQSCE